MFCDFEECSVPSAPPYSVERNNVGVLEEMTG